MAYHLLPAGCRLCSKKRPNPSRSRKLATSQSGLPKLIQFVRWNFYLNCQYAKTRSQHSVLSFFHRDSGLCLGGLNPMGLNLFSFFFFFFSGGGAAGCEIMGGGGGTPGGRGGPVFASGIVLGLGLPDLKFNHEFTRP